jgi:hypothetical protein
MLSANSHSTELTFHTAGGATVVADGIGPRQMLGALDTLSENGWQVVGPPTYVQSPALTTTSYLLRRLRR